MKMKFAIIFFLGLLSICVYAQEDTTDIPQRDPKAAQKIKAAHAAYITERLELTPEEAEKFWPVYREYTQKRQALRQQMRKAKEKGIQEKDLLDLDLKIKQQQLDLEREYSDKFQKVITPQKVMDLKQAEGDFRRLLLRHIQQRKKAQEQEFQPRKQRR